ncbi:10394_t:CDS:2, partial [Racocetra fulgida]
MYLFRNIVTASLVKDNTIIGGKNIIVEIDESKFKAYDNHWVLGIVERTKLRKCFFKMIKDRNSYTLKRLIKTHIKPGSTIYTDSWKGYSDLENMGMGFKHRRVNHKKPSKNQIIKRIHTQRIEGTWNGVKMNILKRDRTKEKLEKHLKEFKFKDFEVLSSWTKLPIIKPRKKSNSYRIVEIDATLFLEISTQKPEITFLTDLDNFHLLKKYTWFCNKQRNTHYICTNKNNQKNLRLHRMIHPEWKMIDHMNRDGCDNRECNLRETTPRENALNCKLFKTNTSKYNGIGFDKFSNRWAKQLAIEYKLEHDKKTGNRN